MDNEAYRKTGGPAFPSEQHETNDNNWNQTFEPGMTLRDYFAAHVQVSLKGVTVAEAADMGVPMPSSSSSEKWFLWKAFMRARLRYIEADAMLRAREQ